MADILNFPRRQPSSDQVLSATGRVDATEATPRLIEDLECGPWTTRKLRIPTSSSGSLIIECFESADGKRLKGSGRMEPKFCLINLKVHVQNAFSLDELALFPYNDLGYPETDFMSHVVNYPKSALIIRLSLFIEESTAQYKLWF